MKLLTILGVLLLAACGGGSNSNPSAVVLPTKPVGTQSTQLLSAGRAASNGQDVPGSVTTSQTTTVVIPAAGSFTVTADQADFYHVTLTLGTVSCDYQHNAGAPGLVNGSGCTTTQSTVSVAPGQMLILDIQANGQTSASSVNVTLALQY